MSTEMTVLLTLLYIGFIAWGYSRKARPNATPTDCNYINYFPEVEEEEESIKVNSSSSSSEDWSTMTDAEFVLALGEMVVPTTATMVAVLPDPWSEVVEAEDAFWDNYYLELELAKCQLEVCYELPTVQLALPPAPVEPITKTVIDYDDMTIRQLKAECKRLGVKKYSYLKKQQLIELLSQQ